MKRENLHQPFEISFSELDESLLKEHEHTFFELVYILSGTGIQWINNNMFPYHDRTFVYDYSRRYAFFRNPYNN